MDLTERKDSTARHPWEVARADFFLRLLDRNHVLEGGGDWLDVGAGDAWFARQLRERVPPDATITCWDINYTPEDIQTLDQLGAENLSHVAARPSSGFDRILMLDVIEHVEDDLGFVGATVRDLLHDDGYVVVSVPAYQALWSSHDRALKHHRRYSPARCRRILERSGLAVVSSGGLFLSLLLPAIGRRAIDRARPLGSEHAGIGNWSRGRVLTSALTRALVLDGRLSLALSERGISVPGLSYWALCRASAA